MKVMYGSNFHKCFALCVILRVRLNSKLTQLRCFKTIVNGGLVINKPKRTQ